MPAPLLPGMSWTADVPSKKGIVWEGLSQAVLSVELSSASASHKALETTCKGLRAG